MENNNKKSFGQIVSNFSMPILLLLLMLVFSIAVVILLSYVTHRWVVTPSQQWLLSYINKKK